MTTVSVVVVNYNRKDMLADCLDSALSQTRPPERVIVVDNGSTDGSAAMVREKFGGRVLLVELAENSGFAGGNNAGMEHVDTEWAALLNNDAVADPCWLAEMLNAAAGRENAGMAACTILRGDCRDLLDNMGVGIGRDGMSRGSRHFCRAAEVTDDKVLIPSGCAALVKTSAFRQAGGFDTKFFCYSEDTDLFLKMRLLGWKTVLAKGACVYHHPGGGTLGVVSPFKTYLVERNRLFVLFRFYPAKAVLLSPYYTLVRYLLLAAEVLKSRKSGPLAAEGSGVFPNLLGLIKAYVHALSGLPSEMGERRRWRGLSCPGSLEKWTAVYGLDSRSLRGLEP